MTAGQVFGIALAACMFVQIVREVVEMVRDEREYRRWVRRTQESLAALRSEASK
jgi:hypothetical protein